MPRLVLLSEGFAGTAFELKAEKTTVGRVSDNNFEIPESSVSSHHAEIVLRGNEVLIRDLGSTNGTFIGGERITEAVLKPGQILRFGTIDLRLESGEVPTAAAAASASAAAAAASKRSLDQTRVIPQGVNLTDLEGARTPLDLKSNTAFTKKSNAGTKVFIGVMAVLVVGLLVVLVIIFTR
jgi:pSer/pThr/pTyr-binding forkhead associated (FHA) protein